MVPINISHRGIIFSVCQNKNTKGIYLFLIETIHSAWNMICNGYYITTSSRMN